MENFEKDARIKFAEKLPHRAKTQLSQLAA
jgi:hypothetical protein